MLVIDRFMSKVAPEAITGCWLWTAHVSKDGYGRFGIGRKAHEAHRVSFKLFNGNIGENLCVDHICKVRSCVNPNHLRLLTREENSKNQINANSLKKVCKNGHEFSLRNNKRICRECQAKASQKYRKEHTA